MVRSSLRCSCMFSQCLRYMNAGAPLPPFALYSVALANDPVVHDKDITSTAPETVGKREDEIIVGGIVWNRGSCSVCSKELSLSSSSNSRFSCCGRRSCKPCAEKHRQKRGARCSQCGVTSPCTPQEFTKRIRKHAKNGNVWAQTLLGSYFEFGDFGLQQSYEKAVDLWTKAARSGDPIAQSDLGTAFLKGRGVSVNEAKAMEWSMKSAMQGFPIAQHNVAVMFYQGKGVPVDDGKALFWFCKAAIQGYEESSKILSTMDERGFINLPPNPKLCAQCFKSPVTREASLLACSRCRSIWYCDKMCQRLHWKRKHKQFCLAEETRNTQTSSAASTTTAVAKPILPCSP